MILVSVAYKSKPRVYCCRESAKDANKKKPYSKKSVNGEPNPHLKQSHASRSEQSLEDSLIEYNQPESFSYLCESHYILSEVDEGVGHTVALLVHR
ncbi:hypothetical protein N7449_007216 [Penicillium cf. viridicatum]|uniref:Uncharacterized protein n=1 Tax=Penicillium cf. viridicatum TaxID=2972119 RepID=A0A9W9JIQ7_9EURO|nr:hypothetical protein N7449_007216 [Penicillium cf. viridicatum]